MGFEVVVRPVVFPNIRPTQARALPPADDPSKGICEIKGTGSFVVNSSHSASFSGSFGRTREIKRQVDVARVYQERDDGSINKENFVDIEVANKIWQRGARAPAQGMSQAERDQRARDAQMYEQWVQYFKRLEEKKNIEIRERNKMIKNEDKDNQ